MTVIDVPGSKLIADNVFVMYAVGRERTAAVRGVSLTVGRGETLGIVGESGSGKTTMARAMAGFVGISSGMVTISGHDRKERGQSRQAWGRRSVQMIVQDASSALDPRWPVWASVAEAVRRNGLTARSRREAATQYLAEVGISGPMLNRLPRELSGGERQRVTIARALAARPQFLICDESTSGLDVSIRGGILNLIVRARAEHDLGIVFISHDIAVVARISDRIAVMYGGLVLEIGPTATILGEPASPYSQALIAASTAGAATPSGRPQSPLAAASDTEVAPYAQATASGCPYRLTCPVVLPVCSQATPQLAPLTAEHSVACHNPQGTL